MTTLFLHIEYLLRTHDCVIVPALGAFIVSRQSARMDKEAGVIIPPMATVTFNSSVSNNDGLLATSIARRGGLDYEVALEILESTVAEIKSELASNRTLTIGSLGTLELGTEGNIVYKPSVKESERFGLHTVLLPRLAPAVEGETSSSSKIISEELIENNESREHEYKFCPEKYYYIPVNKIFARVASVIITVVAAVWAILFFSPEISDASHHDCASVIPVVAPSQPVKSNPIEDSKDSTFRYHLVVGTFTTHEEVERFMNTHSNDGFKLEALHGKKYIRVTAARSNDRSELVGIMKSADVDSCFHHPWIMEN